MHPARPVSTMMTAAVRCKAQHLCVTRSSRITSWPRHAPCWPLFLPEIKACSRPCHHLFIADDKRVFQDRSIQLDLDTCFGMFSPTETLLPILSFIREW